MRVDYAHVLPDAMVAILVLERVVHESTLETRLVELVKLRASQINGCARCVEMHTEDARAVGEDQKRLDLVAVWPDALSFTGRERAALGWCETLTLVADTGATDDSYQQVQEHFDEVEIVALTLAIAAINVWNRLNVGLGAPVGGYVPPP